MRCRHLLPLLTLLCLLCGAAQGEVFRHGDESQPRIAITLDDCYSVKHMEAALGLCQTYGIHVTFFPCGGAVKEKDADIWRRVVAEGHEIGNHTNGHNDLTTLDGGAVKKELLLLRRRVEKALGCEYPMTLMRPPFGRVFENRTLTKLRQAGYDQVILWSVSQTDPEKALQEVKNGSILLYHTNAKDIRCLEVLIPRLQEAGYEMVTVSQLLQGGAQTSAPDAGS